MNDQAFQTTRFSVATPAAQGISAVLGFARVLVAHVRETIGGGSGADRDHVRGMNAYMRRDVGAESTLGPHASANRDLYPRL